MIQKVTICEYKLELLKRAIMPRLPLLNNHTNITYKTLENIQYILMQWGTPSEPNGRGEECHEMRFKAEYYPCSDLLILN